MTQDVKQAVDTLTAALRNDPDYYYAYQANIAMSMLDVWAQAVEYTPDQYAQMHALVNEGAKRFLDLLCKTKPGKLELSGADEIAEERAEQIVKHGYRETDEDYVNGELANAGVYAITGLVSYWPEGWGDEAMWKIAHKDRIGQLRVGGAFCAAEIDRLKKEQATQAAPPSTPAQSL